VHGVLVDGSSWRGVYDVLTRDGYRVTKVQNPMTGLEQVVAATRRVLDQQRWLYVRRHVAVSLQRAWPADRAGRAEVGEA
jgi:hypothetical protein